MVVVVVVESRYQLTAQVLKEGEEGEKWELGFTFFLTGKLGLAFLGLGCLKVGIGNKMLKWDWDV